MSTYYVKVRPTNGGEHDPTLAYDFWTTVFDADTGNSYLSIRDVPAGVEISDTTYWTLYSVNDARYLKIDSRMSLLEAEFATLVATNNDTDGNSELTDIRVAADGTVYTSAGEAVRNQISALVSGTLWITDPNANLITEGEDLNDYTTEGSYKANSYTVAQSLLNSPYTELGEPLMAFRLDVIKVATTATVQIIRQFNRKSQSVYYRAISKSESNRPWRKFAFSDEIIGTENYADGEISLDVKFEQGLLNSSTGNYYYDDDTYTDIRARTVHSIDCTKSRLKLYITDLFRNYTFRIYYYDKTETFISSTLISSTIYLNSDYLIFPSGYKYRFGVYTTSDSSAELSADEITAGFKASLLISDPVLDEDDFGDKEYNGIHVVPFVHKNNYVYQSSTSSVPQVTSPYIAVFKLPDSGKVSISFDQNYGDNTLTIGDYSGKLYRYTYFVNPVEDANGYVYKYIIDQDGHDVFNGRKWNNITSSSTTIEITDDIAGRYMCVVFTFYGNSTHYLLDEELNELLNEYYDVNDLLRICYGSTDKKSFVPFGKIGTFDASGSLITTERSDKVYAYNSKYFTIPIENVNYVCCNPDYAISARIYKFDPVLKSMELESQVWPGGGSREIMYGEYLFCSQAYYGGTSVLDFGGYGKNYYATILVKKCIVNENDKVPECMAGFDADKDSGLYIDWDVLPINVIPADNTIISSNISLIKNILVSTRNTLSARESDKVMRPTGNFTGFLYGSSYFNNGVFYNVSPETYYGALLNPNSKAYYDTVYSHDGYGLVCSNFVTLLYGLDMPLSTMDYRYNPNLPDLFDRNAFELSEDFFNLRKYDALIRSADETGHALMIGNLMRYNDDFITADVYESTGISACQSSRICDDIINNQCDTSGLSMSLYTYRITPKNGMISHIYNKANWTPPYTEPQAVMCNAGYNGLYLLKGSNSLSYYNDIRLSFDEDATEFTLTYDGTSATYSIDSFSVTSLNGYNVISISDLVTAAGEYTVTCGDATEKFNVIDTSSATVTKTTDTSANTVTITTSNNDDVKYISALYCKEGDAESGNSLDFLPDFDDDGNMVIPYSFVADDTGETWYQTSSVYAVFKTDYDTNTYFVTAGGAHGI